MFLPQQWHLHHLIAPIGGSFILIISLKKLYYSLAIRQLEICPKVTFTGQVALACNVTVFFTLCNAL